MINRVASRLGFVPRPQLASVEEKLRELRARLDKTSRLLEQANASIDNLKNARREEAERFEAKLAKVVAEHERRLAQATEALSLKSSRQLASVEEQLRARDAELESLMREGEAMESRVAGAIRDLENARESLMAFDVKLDILEGAANVLDSRLRAANSLRDPAPSAGGGTDVSSTSASASGGPAGKEAGHQQVR